MTKYSYCSVPKCQNEGGHRFPKDEALRRKWIVAIRKRKYIQNWIPREHSRVCRKHFKRSDFVKASKAGNPLAKKRLKPGTIPTIFEWTKVKSISSSVPKKVTLAPRKLVARPKSQSKPLISSRPTSFLKSKTVAEIPKSKGCARAQTFFPKDRSKIITPMKKPAFTQEKSKSEVSMTKEKSIRRDESQDISNWKYRVIRKESLHLEEILGKIEYVFSLQDFNGRELEGKELEEIISTFPPLKPANQILPLRSPHRRSLRNIKT